MTLVSCSLKICSNVGAGRTDEEYKAAQEQRRAELRDDSRTDANYFFIAAGLAALGTGLLPLRLNIAVIIGIIEDSTRHTLSAGAAGPS